MKLVNDNRFQFGLNLGKAGIAYRRGEYALAINHLCGAITLNPNCGSAPRIGIAVCCFMLGNYSRAKAAIDRAFHLDVRVNCYFAVLRLLIKYTNGVSFIFVRHLGHM